MFSWYFHDFAFWALWGLFYNSEHCQFCSGVIVKWCWTFLKGTSKCLLQETCTPFPIEQRQVHITTSFLCSLIDTSDYGDSVCSFDELQLVTLYWKWNFLEWYEQKNAFNCPQYIETKSDTWIWNWGKQVVPGSKSGILDARSTAPETAKMEWVVDFFQNNVCIDCIRRLIANQLNDYVAIVLVFFPFCQCLLCTP